MDNFLGSLYRGICDLKRSFRFLKYYKPHSEILLIRPLGCPKEFEIVHHHLLLMFSKCGKSDIEILLGGFSWMLCFAALFIGLGFCMFRYHFLTLSDHVFNA